MASATAMVAEYGLKQDPFLVLAMTVEYVKNKDVMDMACGILDIQHGRHLVHPFQGRN